MTKNNVVKWPMTQDLYSFSSDFLYKNKQNKVLPTQFTLLFITGYAAALELAKSKYCGIFAVILN